jgi:hypothetical protein
MNEKDFLPTKTEEKRILELFTMTPQDEDDAHHCVFQKKALSAYEQKSGFKVSRVRYRGLKYHPKRLLMQWYFPETVDQNMVHVSCRYNEMCVNPFHLHSSRNLLEPISKEKNEKQKNDNLLWTPLTATERKRKIAQSESLSTETIQLLEKIVFSDEKPKNKVSGFSFEDKEAFAIKKRRFAFLFSDERD